MMEMHQGSRRDSRLFNHRQQRSLWPRHPLRQGQRRAVRKTTDKLDRTARRFTPHDIEYLADMGMVLVSDSKPRTFTAGIMKGPLRPQTKRSSHRE